MRRPRFFSTISQVMTWPIKLILWLLIFNELVLLFRISKDELTAWRNGSNLLSPTPKGSSLTGPNFSSLLDDDGS